MDDIAGIFDSPAAAAVFCYVSIFFIQVFGVWWSWMRSAPERRRERWLRLTTSGGVRYSAARLAAGR